MSSVGRSGQVGVSRDPLRLMIAAIIFLTVGRAHQHFGWIAAVRPLDLLFLASVAFAVSHTSSISLRNLTSTWPPRVVIGLGLMAFVSVPFSLSMGGAGSFLLFTYSKILLVFGLLLVSIRNVGDLKLYAWSYVLACGFLVYLSVFVFGLQPAGGVSRLGGMYYYDANGTALVLSTAIPLCVALFQSSGKIGKVTSALILLGIGVSLARSGSRGGFLGLAAVGVVLLIVVRGVSIWKRVAFVGVVAAGLLVASPQGYWQQLQSLTNPTQDYNWTSPYGRKAIALRGLGYLMDNPATGLGVGQFPRAEAMLSDVTQQRRAMNEGFKWAAAHNSYLQVAAELGIPGLILFCALVFGTPVSVYRLRRRLPRGWRTAGGKSGFVYDLALYLPASLVGFAVTCTFLSFAYHDILYMLTAFAAGTFVSARQIVRQKATDRRAAVQRHESLKRAS